MSERVGALSNWGLRSRAYRAGFICLLLGLLCISYGNVNAFNIPTGNDDLVLRWDNTLRYTLQSRVADQEDALLRNPNGDDGDRNFKDGIVSNRIDVLSEADLVYKQAWGVRASGAFWYDQAYSGHFDNDSVATSNYLENGVQDTGIYNQAERFFEGPSGELLDCFAFGRIDIGNTSHFIKVGRHTYYWGEALLNPIHSISYGQMPLDLAKATAQPGVEVKEVFRPRNSVSVVSQLSPDFQLAAQYFLEWEEDMLPEAGTYFSSSDLSVVGRGAMIMGPGVFFQHGDDIEPDDRGDFGISAKWSPNFLDGTFGFYYRNFSDTLPQAVINLADATYHYEFADDIDMFGISYATEVFGLSLGADFNYRRNMPLNSEAAVVADASYLPKDGDTLGARGETLHCLINLLGTLKRTPIWEAGSWNVEFGYSRWLEVDEGKEYFKGRSAYNGFDEVTRDNGIIAGNFSPQWLQVLPGVDLSLPITASYGLWGVSSVANGGAENDGSWGVGLALDIYTKYKVNLNYVNYFGEIERDPVTGIASSRGGNGLLRDRDFVSLTLKTSF